MKWPSHWTILSFDNTLSKHATGTQFNKTWDTKKHKVIWSLIYGLGRFSLWAAMSVVVLSVCLRPPPTQNFETERNWDFWSKRLFLNYCFTLFITNLPQPHHQTSWEFHSSWSFIEWWSGDWWQMTYDKCLIFFTFFS